MGSRMKEDEKNERIIRGLLKQPCNRKCINCNLLGPQYVCTTFSTFVCTTCSGIHREFTHRVKSISMAKFTPQEIAALQAGGNERAREIYFKEWEPQRNSAPDSSNVDRLRDFIKQVYVHRRYAGERSIDQPPRTEQGDKEDPSDSRRSDGYRSGSQSPPFNDTRASPGYDVRSSYDQYNQRHSDYGRSPIRSGVVNDWRREDRFANGRKSEDRRSSDGETRSDPRSPDHLKDSSVLSPPVVRPVRDILGDSITPLCLSAPPVINGGKTADGPTFTQRTTSSSSLTSSNSNPAEPIKETSLIDFDAEPESSLNAATTQAQPSTASASSDNWACFDNFPENKVSQSFLDSNSSKSALTQLSMPAPAPMSGAANSNVAPAPLGDLFSLSNGGDAFASAGNGTTAAFPGAPATASTGGAAGAPTMLPVNGGTGQWSAMQPGQPPFLHGTATQPASQLLPSSFSGPNNHGLIGIPRSQGSQVQNPAAQTEEVKSSGRRELPADLFTATYTATPYQAPGWQAGGLVPGMGYHMHFSPAMAMPTFPQPNKSANPFDVNSESSVQPAAFPSMSSLRSALPNTGASGGLPPGPNLGNAMPSWMPSQSSSYQSTAPPQPAQSFGVTMPGEYMGQQLPSNFVSPSLRFDGFGDFSNRGIGMSPVNPAAATSNPSLGGNPFG